MKMKKYLSFILIMLLAAGCSKNNKIQQTDITAENDYVESKDKVTDSMANNTEAETPSDNKNHALPPHVMVDGVLYKDTGYVSSMAGCGNMDGEITGNVECTELPTENDQSNFGTGYGYQLIAKDKIAVMIDGQKIIFRSVLSDETGIPAEVANFDAEIKEITEDGRLLVSFIRAAEGFIIDEGEYYVPSDNLRGDVRIGDTVRIWYNGLIMETYPAQLGNVYRIERIQEENNENALYSVLYLGYQETPELDRYVKEYLNGKEPESIFVSDGDVYLFIPQYEGMKLEIWKHDIETEQDALIYETKECRPFLLHCNASDIFGDATIKLEYKNEIVEFSPFISLKDGSIDIGDRGLILNE